MVTLRRSCSRSSYGVPLVFASQKCHVGSSRHRRALLLTLWGQKQRRWQAAAVVVVVVTQNVAIEKPAVTSVGQQRMRSSSYASSATPSPCCPTELHDWHSGFPPYITQAHAGAVRNLRAHRRIHRRQYELTVTCRKTEEHLGREKFGRVEVSKKHRRENRKSSSYENNK